MGRPGWGDLAGSSLWGCGARGAPFFLPGVLLGCGVPMQTKEDAPRRVGLWTVCVLASGRVQMWSPFCLSDPAADWADQPGVLGVALKIAGGLNATAAQEAA